MSRVYVTPNSRSEPTVWIVLEEPEEGVMVVRAFTSPPKNLKGEVLEVSLDVYEEHEK